MAVKYGCRNEVTGQIEFDVCSAGDYMACRVESGAHAGQIEITISEIGCDDTYYGCIDRATGKFQISVPNDCCCPCATVDFCQFCFDPDDTPDYLAAVVSGVAGISDGGYCLEYGCGGGDCMADIECQWTKVISEDLFIIYATGEHEDQSYVCIGGGSSCFIGNVLFTSGKNPECQMGVFNNQRGELTGTVTITNPCA